MSSSVEARVLNIDLEETREALVSSARRAFGSIPAEHLVEHVLATTDGADFAVREAAMEALARRWRFALRDGLTVASRPAPRGALGTYTTGCSAEQGRPGGRRKKGIKRGPKALRPYKSVLESIEPLAGSCDCPDYLRSSLGLCKHLLIVLDDVFSNKRRLAVAREERTRRARAPRITWDPGLPLLGQVDRLVGLQLREPERLSRAASDKLRRAKGLFSNGRLDERNVADPEQRQQTLATLSSLVRRGKGGAIQASPAVIALVAEESERTDRLARNASSARKTLAHTKTLRRKLYPYQREGLSRFLQRGRLLLADDMGLGKTTQAIAACHVLFESGRARRGVLVVPAGLKSQWLREWKQTSRAPCDAVDGRPEERAVQYERTRSGFVVIGYEQLLRDIEHIQRLSPDIVVLDEAQRIKNYATKSAVYVKSLQPEFRLVLTGTPMENRLEELASILDWVDDVALAPKWRLVPWHTVWTGDGSTSGRAGARNLDTLRARLAPSVVRRVRQDVLDQLPPRTDTRVPVEMTPQQRAEHDDLNEPIAQLTSASNRRPLSQPEFLRLMSLLTKQRIISNGLGQLRFEEVWPAYRDVRPDAALLEGLFAPKLVEFRRLVEEVVFEQQRKAVVFSQWRRMLRLCEWSLRDLLCDAGARAVFFTGAERPTQRTRNIVDFHDDPDARILFLSDAGGVGLNLQRAANVCINLELPWNPAVLEQRIGRIYRLGQKRSINVYSLVSEYGIEARIANIVGTKRALFAGLFDGTSDQIQFQSGASFLTSVEQLLETELPDAPPRPVPHREESEADQEIDATEAESQGEAAEDAIADRLPEIDEAGDAQHGNGERENGRAATDPNRVESPAALLEALRVERTTEGGVRIEAPREAAQGLIDLFNGMARLLQKSVR